VMRASLSILGPSGFAAQSEEAKYGTSALGVYYERLSHRSVRKRLSRYPQTPSALHIAIHPVKSTSVMSKQEISALCLLTPTRK
jgi:hypothetical protein